MAKPRVLVVDDDHNYRLLLSSTMARAGFDVDAVADGAMAIATITSRPPQLVLLDAYLPLRSGFEVCRAVKDNQATSHTPVIIISAMANDETREQSLAAGADEFLAKPCDADTLLEIVEQLMKIKKAADQLDPGEQAVVKGLDQGK